MGNELSVASMTKLAKIANEAAAKAEQCAYDAVQEAVKCGDALNAAKEKCPHGEWETWIEGNFHYSVRTAQQFMKLAKAQHAALLDDCKSVRQALIAVSEVEKKAAIPERSAEKPVVVEQPAKPDRPQEVLDAEWESTDETPEADPQEVVEPKSVVSIVKDSLNREVPDELRNKYAVAAVLGAIGRKLDAIKREVVELADDEGGWFIPVQEVELASKNLKDMITDAGYWTACPRCNGKGCKRCDSSGFVPKSRKNMLSHEDKEALGL